jgi:protein-L-isoaspartate(D-aspartate) O-methyltransferase
MPGFRQARETMVASQIAARGVKDEAVLEAMQRIPREAFVAPGYEDEAYDDRALPIGEGQTISQPYVVALMIEAAGLKPGDRVLEVGAGSGYAAAVMSRIAGHVYAIERHASLAETATARLARMGYGNIDMRTGDGTKGWSEEAPFDAILVSAGGPAVPEALKSQLQVGGRLVIPVGSGTGPQHLVKITRASEDTFAEEDLGKVMFVPLVGEGGWPEDSPG